MTGKSGIAAAPGIATVLFLRCLSWGGYVFISYLECTSLLISICDQYTEKF